jgi:hypothetical protein
MAIMNEWVTNMSDVMWTTQRDEYKIKLLVLAQRNETDWVDTTKSPADTHHLNEGLDKMKRNKYLAVEYKCPANMCNHSGFNN